MSARAVGTLQEIFEARVEKTDSCWIWIGAIGHGYGILRLLSRGIYDYAHRISVRLDGRDIPDGMHVDHLCRNTRCVNPAHLEVVTPAVNLARGLMRQRSQEHFASRTHCAHGHPWNEENTYRNSKGYRNCRACHRERARGPDFARRHRECPKGHTWTPENTAIRSDGVKRCRTCSREQTSKRYWARKAAKEKVS